MIRNRNTNIFIPLQCKCYIQTNTESDYCTTGLSKFRRTRILIQKQLNQIGFDRSSTTYVGNNYRQEIFYITVINILPVQFIQTVKR
jgi:hypothetical protein